MVRLVATTGLLEEHEERDAMGGLGGPPPGVPEGREPGGGEGARGTRAELGLEIEDNDCRYLLSHLFTFILS